jgi:hypothetical protein
MRLGTYNYGTHEAFDTHGVSLGKFNNVQQADRAMVAIRLPASFWLPETIAAIPLLQQLNDWVTKQNERRLPKWKFRFATDLAAQIQPKITRAHLLLFECLALQAPSLTVKWFTEPTTRHGHPYWRIVFKLTVDDQNNWTFKATSAERGQGCPRDGLIDLRRRIIAALLPDCFVALTPNLMLSPHCLCCGKGLTDPVSMARWIGPECWGSASANLPRLFKTTEPAS